MRQIRQLYFQNSAGQRRGLNGQSGVYATSLSGFGVSLAPGFADLGKGFFSVSSEENEPQNKLAFVMVFTRKAYETYKQFVDWLSAAGTLTIVYNSTGAQEYYRDVTVEFLQKSELNQHGWLEVPCSFSCCTPWYLPTPTTLRFQGSGTPSSKRYPYRYTSALRYGSGSAAAISTTIAGAGHIPGALELTFYGAVTNPRIRLTGQISGRVYGICSLDIALGGTDTLRYSSRYENSYVKKVSAEGIETDLLNDLKLSTAPFFHIPVNEPCTISFEADTTFTGTVEMLIYYYYRSV